MTAKAKARGLRAPDKSIRTAANNLRSELKRAKAKAAPAAARQTAPPKPAPAPADVAPAAAAAVPAPTPAAAPTDLAAVLATVAAVNRVVRACGGVENARQAADAVRACGGVEPFLLHLDLLAGLTAGTANG